MQTPQVAVCNMDLFGEGTEHFWISELSRLLERFPFLEFPHRQNFYTLYFVETAEGKLTTDNQTVRLDKAKALVIKPRCISSIDINRTAKGKIICFTEEFFSLRYNNNILYQFRFLQQENAPCVRLTEKQLKRFNLLLTLLEGEFKSDKKQSRKVLRSYLNIILFELERLFNTSETVRINNPRQEKIHRFKNLVRQHFETRKTPSAYADLLNVSPNYLNKLCKEETGQTAGGLIRKEITIEAQRLLQHTHHTINEIADMLGFENTSYFITFFKKQTGITPEKFRNQK